MSIEPCHQISHGRATVQAGLVRRLDKHPGPRHCQQCCGPTHLVDTLAAAAGDALQSRLLGAAQATQRLTLWGWHGICLLPVKYPAKTPAPAISGVTH
jgi:hypothetical protein